MTGVLERVRRGGLDTRLNREGDVKMEAETSLMHSQPKEHQELPAITILVTNYWIQLAKILFRIFSSVFMKNIDS